jgi:hypothetical protein
MSQKDGVLSVRRALGEGCDREPPSPVGLFIRLGLLMLIALCFGLAAKLLVGAA